MPDPGYAEVRGREPCRLDRRAGVQRLEGLHAPLDEVIEELAELLDSATPAGA